jgi:hypothetical protein
MMVEINHYKLSLSTELELDEKYAEWTPPQVGLPSAAVQIAVQALRREESPTKLLPTMDRPTFVKTLGDLTPADFELFVTTIPKAASHVSRQGAIREKAAELIGWAESPTGPGLEAVQEAYQSFS